MQTRVLNAISLDFLNWYWQINFAQLFLMFFLFFDIEDNEYDDSTSWKH